jgi:hypothetical protein
MLLDDKTVFVKKDSIVYIPKGVFHRPINPTTDDMVFETISPGKIARPALPREALQPSSPTSPASSLRTY